MTIGTNNRNDAIGTNSTPTYPYGFKILDATDLRVTVRDLVGAETRLTYPTHYSVAGVGLKAGGSITLVGGGNPWQDGSGNLLTGVSISTRRVRPLTQETDIRNQGDFAAEVHEDTFDNLTMVLQQQQDELDRSIKIGETHEAFNADLPAIIAGAAIGYNATGDGLATILMTGSAAISAFMLTVLDDANAAAVRATLGIAASDNVTFGNITANGINAAAVTANALLSNGAISSTGDINVGALLLTAGVKYPATQTQSSDVHVLDDYEEGVWTPVVRIGGSSVGVTYVQQSGLYTKIGRMVFCEFMIGLTSKGGLTGQVSITGLPFQRQAVTLNAQNVGLVNWWANLNTAQINMGLFLNGSSTVLDLSTLVAASTNFITGLDGAALTNSSQFSACFAYMAAT